MKFAEKSLWFHHRTLSIVGGPASGKTVLIVLLYHHLTSNKGDRTWVEGGNKFIEEQDQRLQHFAFPKRTTVAGVESVKFRLKSTFVTLQSVAGEILATKGGKDISEFLSDNYCLWVQNPFLIDEKFTVQCLLGFIALMQKDKRFLDSDGTNLIRIATEALFSEAYGESAASASIDDLMSRKYERWPALVNMFDPQGFKVGNARCEIHLKRDLIDPLAELSHNFEIKYFETDYRDLIEQGDVFEMFVDLCKFEIQRWHVFNIKSAQALKNSPRTSIYFSHLDLLVNTNVIFSDSILRSLCDSWLGIHSKRAKRTIYTQPILKTTILPLAVAPLPIEADVGESGSSDHLRSRHVQPDVSADSPFVKWLFDDLINDITEKTSIYNIRRRSVFLIGLICGMLLFYAFHNA